MWTYSPLCTLLNTNDICQFYCCTHRILSTWCYTCQLKESNAYVDLFKSILKLSEAFKINPTAPPSNILRLALLDLGNALYSDDENEVALLTFLFRLRALARTHFMVVLASLSTDFNVRHPFGSVTHQKVTELVDISVTLTSFGKDERAKGAFKEHHGILEIDKAAPLNCLQNSASFKSIKNKHLFKSLRTKFTISPMHLPPSDSEEKSSSTPIAGAASNSLDFWYEINLFEWFTCYVFFIIVNQSISLVAFLNMYQFSVCTKTANWQICQMET